MTVPENVNKILSILHDHNFEGYMVGGCVRDYFLNKSPKDYDITTNALPDEVISIFSDYKVIPTGYIYGTITVMIDNEPFEITTYRKDSNYSDGRRPDEVSFSNNIYEDLKRRDFTINSMAYDSINNKLIDPFNGCDDLEKGIIRCVGKPDERFSEDGLRLLRAIRFATRYNFSIENETFNSIIKNKEMIHNVSNERIAEEINKILMTKFVSKGLNLLHMTWLDNEIFPEISKLRTVVQNHSYHDGQTVWEHTIKVLNYMVENDQDLELRLAALFHDTGKPKCKFTNETGDHFYDHNIESTKIVESFLRKYKYSNDVINRVKNIVFEHDYKYSLKRMKFKKKLRKSKTNFMDYYTMRMADIYGQSKSKLNDSLNEMDKLISLYTDIMTSNEPYLIKHLTINGNDIIKEFNVSGIEVKNYLEKALTMVLSNPLLNEKEILLKKLKR